VASSQGVDGWMKEELDMPESEKGVSGREKVIGE
jgi:hypothetical protein